MDKPKEQPVITQDAVDIEKKDDYYIDPVREARLRLKLDLKIVPYLSLLYLISFLDRANVGNAHIAGLDASIGLVGSDYNWALSIFFIGYVLFEVPSNLLFKKLKPSNWLPIIMTVWGVIMICMSQVKDFAGLMSARFFLGVAECGLFPGVVFFISVWYLKREQSLRIALIYGSATIAGAFGGLIAYGIQHSLDGVNGLKAWQWIFIIEGVPAVFFAILSKFYLPDFPEDAHWLTTEEREMVEARLAKDAGVAHNNEFSVNQLYDAFKDWHSYVWMLMYIGCTVPLYSISLFLPSIMTGLGYVAIQAQLMTVPVYACACLSTFAFAFSSDRFHERTRHLIAAAVFSCISFIILSVTTNHTVQYIFACFATMGNFPTVALCLAFMTNNVAPQTKRGVVAAMTVSFGNIGGAIGGQIYRAADAPHYVPGHATNAAFMLLTALTASFMFFNLTRVNRQRDAVASADAKAFDGDSSELGDRHPDYRYTL